MNQYLGEIRMFGGNFAPQGWEFCDGQLLRIVEYETLFNLIGTTYGGDGQTNFALPDLRNRAPAHHGPQLALGQESGIAASAPAAAGPHAAPWLAVQFIVATQGIFPSPT